jgi:hypothetical protein
VRRASLTALTIAALLTASVCACQLLAGYRDLESATATGWCAAQPPHSFCADFDEDAGLDAGWSISTQMNPATLSIDTHTSTSPPASVLATSPANDAGLYDDIQKQLPLTSDAHVMLDLWIGTYGTGASLAEIDVGAQPAYQLHLTSVPGGSPLAIVLAEQYWVNAAWQYTPVMSPVDIPPSTWTHVDLALSASAGTATATLAVGDGGAKTYPLAHAPSSFGQMGSGQMASFGFGVDPFDAPPLTAWQARFDNIAIDSF